MPVYPDIQVEISVHSGFIDIVEERFDAGVRLGETIAQDMVAVRIGPDMRMAAVASPAYFSARRPLERRTTSAVHNCINLRFPTRGGLYAWEFEKAGRALNVRVEGQLVVNEIALALQAALDGLGIAYLPEDYVRADIEGRTPDARARILVSAVPGLSSLLPEPPPSIAGLHASGGGAALPQLMRHLSAASLMPGATRSAPTSWIPMAEPHSPRISFKAIAHIVTAMSASSTRQDVGLVKIGRNYFAP